MRAYSITPSAVESTVGETSSPSALAGLVPLLWGASCLPLPLPDWLQVVVPAAACGEFRISSCHRPSARRCQQQHCSDNNHSLASGEHRQKIHKRSAHGPASNEGTP